MGREALRDLSLIPFPVCSPRFVFVVEDVISWLPAPAARSGACFRASLPCRTLALWNPQSQSTLSSVSCFWS